MRCSCDAAPWSQAEHFMKLFLGMVSKSKYAETVAPGVFAEEAGPFVRQEEFISNMLRKQFVCYLFLLYLLFLLFNYNRCAAVFHPVFLCIWTLSTRSQLQDIERVGDQFQETLLEQDPSQSDCQY